MAEYEANVKASSHTLSSYAGPTYDLASTRTQRSPESAQIEAEAYAHRLGSGNGEDDHTHDHTHTQIFTNTFTVIVNEPGPMMTEDSPEARRERVLAATLRRLEKEEVEIENMCGSGRKK